MTSAGTVRDALVDLRLVDELAVEVMNLRCGQRWVFVRADGELEAALLDLRTDRPAQKKRPQKDDASFRRHHESTIPEEGS